MTYIYLPLENFACNVLCYIGGMGGGGWYTKYIDWESQLGDPDPHFLPYWHNRQHHLLGWYTKYIDWESQPGDPDPH